MHASSVTESYYVLQAGFQLKILLCYFIECYNYKLVPSYSEELNSCGPEGPPSHKFVFLNEVYYIHASVMTKHVVCLSSFY